MKIVGIRDLEDRLSEYLLRAGWFLAGETVRLPPVVSEELAEAKRAGSASECDRVFG